MAEVRDEKGNRKRNIIYLSFFIWGDCRHRQSPSCYMQELDHGGRSPSMVRETQVRILYPAHFYKHSKEDKENDTTGKENI